MTLVTTLVVHEDLIYQEKGVTAEGSAVLWLNTGQHHPDTPDQLQACWNGAWAISCQTLLCLGGGPWGPGAQPKNAISLSVTCRPGNALRLCKCNTS